MLRYRSFPHTADLGLQAWGRTLPELYANAAEGMCALYFDLPAVQLREKRTIVAQGYDREEVLIDWLRELLYRIEVEQFLPGRFEIQELSETNLRAEVAGETFDPARHRWCTGIKAATYHDLHIERGKKGMWAVRIIFDT
jgi:SHS2 domain-containing protein